VKVSQSKNLKVCVLIPALNESASVGLVIRDLPPGVVDKVIVCDNGSTDGTPDQARKAGAEVVVQPLRGYGNACLCGLSYLGGLSPSEQPDVVVFLDGDYSDYPEELIQVIGPIVGGRADLVIGSRMAGKMEKGAMTFPQRFGNWLAPLLIHWFFGQKFTDLGPFRAIRWDSLQALGMEDKNFGWTVEMQVKAAKKRLRCEEVPVRYRRREHGRSKVSGTIKGTVLAGVIIIGVIFREFFRDFFNETSPF
jgi:glycosyltransferase involved in cell wall biosynthesis